MSAKVRHTTERVNQLAPSGIRKFFDLLASMEGVISLGVGEPDFTTPWHISEAAIYSLEKGQTMYTSNSGMPELRSELSRYLKDSYKLSYDPNAELLITVGVSEALDLTMRALLDPGDEVILPDPHYVSYDACVSLAGGTPIMVPTREKNNFELSAADVEARITGKTKAILIGYPSNPTGAVMSREKLLKIAEVARRHRLLVISDEIYARLIYGVKHTCFATLPMAQLAAIEALKSGEPSVVEMVEDYNRRRLVMVKGLHDIGLPCFEPKGAFYAFPSIKKTGMTSEEFAEKLLKEEKVAVVPGTAFGQGGEGYVRCCYATSLAEIEEALLRMGRFVKKYKRGK
jgi:aminotransferase